VSEVSEGTWSVAGDKLRITYLDGVESVLFEDTASISFQSRGPQSSFGKNVLYIISAGFILYSIKLLFEGEFGAFFFGMCMALGIAFPGISQPGPHGVVSIETVGGKVVMFQCAYGSGAETMELIEEAKRNWQNS
jgi:hypothetical protein